MSLLNRTERKSRREKAGELKHEKAVNRSLPVADVKYKDMPLIGSTKGSKKIIITSTKNYKEMWDTFFNEYVKEELGEPQIESTSPGILPWSYFNTVTGRWESIKKEEVAVTPEVKEGEKDVDYVEATDDDDWI